jgi:hypothetical protein
MATLLLLLRPDIMKTTKKNSFGNLQFGAWSSGTQEAAAACIKVSH